VAVVRGVFRVVYAAIPPVLAPLAGPMLVRNIRALAKRQVTDMLAAAIQWDDPHATSSNRCFARRNS